jgi:hypothetical protein
MGTDREGARSASTVIMRSKRELLTLMASAALGLLTATPVHGALNFDAE